jgi:hypothetical protein
MSKNNKICNACEHCQYHSEGDSFCDINYEFVLEDWLPTYEFLWCGGKNWRKQ